MESFYPEKKLDTSFKIDLDEPTVCERQILVGFWLNWESNLQPYVEK